MEACATYKPNHVSQYFLSGLHTRKTDNRAISSELHAELTKGNRQVCWRFLRRLFKLYEQDGAGLSLQEIERFYQLCAASDEDSLQVRKKHPLPQACHASSDTLVRSWIRVFFDAGKTAVVSVLLFETGSRKNH